MIIAHHRKCALPKNHGGHCGDAGGDWSGWPTTHVERCLLDPDHRGDCMIPYNGIGVSARVQSGPDSDAAGSSEPTTSAAPPGVPCPTCGTLLFAQPR